MDADDKSSIKEKIDTYSKLFSSNTFANFASILSEEYKKYKSEN